MPKEKSVLSHTWESGHTCVCTYRDTHNTQSESGTPASIQMWTSDHSGSRDGHHATSLAECCPKKSLMILITSINFGIRFYSSWRTFKIRHFYRMWGVGQIISKRGKCRLLIRQLLLHSLKMNFCQSIAATWVSDVPHSPFPAQLSHFTLGFRAQQAIIAFDG